MDYEKNVKIFVYHNCFKIYPYIKSKWNKELHCMEGTCPKLDNQYLIFEEYRGFINKKDILHCYDKKTKTLTLPYGFGLKKIEEKLYENDVIYEIIDKKDVVVKPKEVNYEIQKDIKIRNKYQAESVEFLTNPKLGHSKLLALSTGIGKTVCAVFGAYRLKVPMFICSETLCDQWMDKISIYTDCNKSNKGVKIIKGTDNLHNLLNIPKEKLKYAFVISTSSTLSSYLEKYGTLNPIYQHLGIGIFCFDEYHMNWAQNVQIESDCQVENIWRLTATPSRTVKNEKLVFDRMTKEISVYGLNTISLNNYATLRLVDYNTYPKEEEIGSCMTVKGLSAVLYWNYIFDNENRKMYILGMIKQILDPLLDTDDTKKILIYLAKLEHIQIFKELLESLYEKEHKYIKFGNYTTDSGNKKIRLRQLKNRVIFTTIQSGGVGLDLDELVAVLSLVPYSSSITASQMIGRLRYIPDTELLYYDFIDLGFKSMEKQRFMRMNILKMKSNPDIRRRYISYENAIEYLKEFI